MSDQSVRYTSEPHGITTIDAHYINPGVASIQMLVEAGHAVFFDTGTSLSLPTVLKVLRLHGLTPAEVEFVVPTHVHLDHAGGAGAMMRVFQNARLIIHPRGARHMADPSKLWMGTLAVYGEETTRKLYGEVVPIDRDRMIVADDGFELDFHGRQLTFLDTPGHARHHFCVVDLPKRVIFAGDTMGISYRMFDGPNGPFLFPTSSPVQFEPDKLHQSIDRLMATDPQSIYLTHFGRIDPTLKMIESLHRQIDDFVSIAKDLSDQSDVEKTLEPAIASYLLEQAKHHGVPLDDSEIRAGLDMDARLNASGIAIWLARQTGDAEV